MGKRYRLILALFVVVLSLSLFGIVQDISTHNFGFGTFWFSVFGFIVSLRYLWAQLHLTGAVFLNKLTLKLTLQGMQRAPWHPDGHLAIGKSLMILASYQFDQTRLLLSWEDPKKYVRAIEGRITKDLEGVTAALQALNNAYLLDGPHLLARKGGTIRELQVTARGEFLAQAHLARFKVLFPQEVVAKQIDFEPGETLLKALSSLCSSIYFNPVCAEAFESGQLLMAYLHHEEIADAFQKIAHHIVHAHE